MGTQFTRPTARWNRETGRADPLEGGAPPPSPAYSDGQASVKGIPVRVFIPYALVEKAERYGLPLETLVKVGALRRIQQEIKAKGTPTVQDRTANSPEAAAYRSQLGYEIMERRKALKLSRRGLHQRLGWLVEQIPGELMVHGWSEGQVQQWENGKSAPRQIEPIIEALQVDEATANRWRGWWGASRRGAPQVDVPAPEPIDYEEQLRQHGNILDPRTAIEKLERTLADGDGLDYEAELAAKDAELAADPRL
jgi:transcriptional regulator with XRE-family HTH domain